MTLTEFVQSDDFTSTEKLIITYMLLNNNRNFSLSLKELQLVFNLSYLTAQKSMKNLTNSKILSASLVRDNSPTKYVILLN